MVRHHGPKMRVGAWGQGLAAVALGTGSAPSGSYLPFSQGVQRAPGNRCVIIKSFLKLLMPLLSLEVAGPDV